ncbi:MAG: DUF421 domain-containing protein [Bacillota bacterium]
MESLLVYIVRCVIMVLGIWIVSLILGKKSLLQFSAFDIGILMIVSNVIAQPLVSKDIFKTAIGAIILIISIIIIGRMSLKKKFYRADYKPSILVSNGIINKQELRKNHMSIYSLLSLLRAQGYSKVSDVNFAVLELGGSISVIPKNSARPVTVKDMNLPVAEAGFTFPVIMDGAVYPDMLEAAGYTEKWLVEQLTKSFKCEPGDVFYAEVESGGQLFVNLYTQSDKNEINLG